MPVSLRDGRSLFMRMPRQSNSPLCPTGPHTTPFPQGECSAVSRWGFLVEVTKMVSDSTCSDCGKTLKSPHGLAIHLSNVHGRRQATRFDVPCAQCGKPKRVAPCHVRRSERVFCSAACSARWRGEHTQGTDNPGFTSRQVPCTECGRLLLRQPNEIERSARAFCDHACYGQWLSAHRSGEQHHAWIDGRSWANGRRARRSWRGEIVARAGGRCETCGSEKNLVAHHVKDRLTNPELRNDLSNGVALCRSCHNKAHGLQPDTQKGWATRRAKEARLPIVD